MAVYKHRRGADMTILTLPGLRVRAVPAAALAAVSALTQKFRGQYHQAIAVKIEIPALLQRHGPILADQVNAVHFCRRVLAVPNASARTPFTGLPACRFLAQKLL